MTPTDLPTFTNGGLFLLLAAVVMSAVVSYLVAARPSHTAAFLPFETCPQCGHERVQHSRGGGPCIATGCGCSGIGPVAAALR